MTDSASVPLVDRLREAIEGRDAAGLMRLYADDAVLTVIDRDHPPSAPTIVEGKAKIAAYFEDVCGRPMTHKVEAVIEQDGKLAFTQACRHQDGWRVTCASMAELRLGRIVRQTNLQVWDA